MKIRSITASYSRTLPDPNVDYAGHKFFASITADVGEEEHVPGCMAKLQTQARNLVDKEVESVASTLSARSRSHRAENKTADTAAQLADKHGK